METEIIIHNENDLRNKIYTIRGVHVMLDSDLAEIYGYETIDFYINIIASSCRNDCTGRRLVLCPQEEDKEKEDAKNKAKNSLEEMKALFSKSEVRQAASNYVSRDDAIALGNELF